MDHGGETARPTTVRSAYLAMAGAVQGGEAHISTGSLQLGAAAAARRAAFRVHAAVGRGEVPDVPVFIGASGLQPGPADVALVGLPLPGGVVVVPLHDGYDYSVLLPRSSSTAGIGLALADLLPYGGGDGGTEYNVVYALQLRPGAGHGEVLLVDVLPDGARHGEVHADLLPGGVDAVHDDYRYYYALQPRPAAGRGVVLADHLPGGGGGGGAVHSGDYVLQPRPGAGHGEVLVDLLPDDGAGHGVVFVGLLPGAVDAAYDNYGDYGPLPDGVGAVLDNSNSALRRLIPLVGIGASSVAVNGLAAGPGSPAAAFHLFVLLLGGLFLVILHVIRV